MSYATQRDSIARTPQDLVVVGVRECQNWYATIVMQLLVGTSDLSNLAWTGVSATETPDFTTAPDGTMTADLVNFDADNDAFRQSGGVAAASKAFTGSIWLKSFSGFGTQLVSIRVRDNISSEIGVKQVMMTEGAWLRVWVEKKFTAGASGNVTFEVIRLAGDATGSFYVWGANLYRNPADVDREIYFPTIADGINSSRCAAPDQGDGARCFYSRPTCQDSANFNAGNIYETTPAL